MNLPKRTVGFLKRNWKILKKKIHLQKELNRQKEEQIRRDIENRKIGWQEQKLELDKWVKQRKEEAKKIT